MRKTLVVLRGARDELIPRPPRWTNPDIEAFVAARGGLFRLAGEHRESTRTIFRTLVASFDRDVEYAESHLYEDCRRRITYGVLCSSDFNAFAYATPPEGSPPLDFVGINVGVIFTLVDTFARILAHPASFPDVGDPALEDPGRCAPRPLTTNVMSLAPSAVGPNCHVRSGFAGTLALTALRYLFFHEITHLRHGHCEYGREHLQDSYLAELLDCGDLAEPIVRQTLEMDADSGAVLHTLNQALIQKSILASTMREIDPPTLAVIQAAFSDTKRATRTVAYSAYVLFRLFDDTGWNHSVQSLRSHPQPAIRMSWIGPTLYAIFSQHPSYGYEPEAFATDVAQILVDAEVDCGRIQGLPPDPRGIKSVYSTALSVEYLSRLKGTWSSIRPYLENHKRGGKLPD